MFLVGLGIGVVMGVLIGCAIVIVLSEEWEAV